MSKIWVSSSSSSQPIAWWTGVVLGWPPLAVGALGDAGAWHRARRARAGAPADRGAPRAPRRPAATGGASCRYCSSLAFSSSISAAKVFFIHAAEILARVELAGGVEERLQVVVQVDRVLVAVLRSPCASAFSTMRSSSSRDLLVVRRRRQDLDVADLLQRREVALADEQPLAGEQLVEHDADREDVAAPVDRQAAHLLGRHVAELALEDARPGSCDALPAALAMPKSISLTSPSYADEDVLRRDVAVDEVQLAALRVALVVRVVEPLADLHDDEAGLRDRHRLAALAAQRSKMRAQVLAVDVLERDEVAVVDLAEVEDLGDVRVAAAGRRSSPRR